MTHRITAVPALIAASILAVGLAGCASAEPAAEPGISVVATTTQVADFTTQVAGDAAQVTSLIQPNQSSHSFDPTAADLAALAAADVLVINGAGLEEWLDGAIEASGFAGVTIDASTGVTLMEFAKEEEHAHEGEEEAHTEDDHAHEGDDHSHDHDHSHEEEAAAEPAPEATAEATEEEHDHDHSHEGGDPHIWTSAGNAIAMVAAIADGLADVDAENADAFSANAAAYIAQLEVLDAWIIENMDQVDPADRLLVTNHEAFGYFVDAYGVTFVGAVIPSFDDNAEVSAADIDKLVAAIRDSGAPAVFSETSLSPEAAETIAAEAGVAVFSGDEGLFGDSLGPEGSSGETYIASMIHNVTVLIEAWGASVTALPAELSE
jgi:ABC-type Zn uptake system ZnuABC Zn-binding protein ZnuA